MVTLGRFVHFLRLFVYDAACRAAEANRVRWTVGLLRRRLSAAEARLEESEAARRELERQASEASRRLHELDGQLESASRQLEEVGRMKDDFLATLSHELRTPLNASLGWIQLLRLHITKDAERAYALDVIERNTRAQIQIVSDLLDVSRLIAGKLQLRLDRIDLQEVVQLACNGVRGAAAAKKIDLRVEVEPLPAAVTGDSVRLQQAVWNLVSNAVKFTPSGGTVAVRVYAADVRARIEVCDSGIGIGADVLPHIFERFRQADSSLTREFGGLGLGLAIVKHLAELHGGTVEAFSTGPGLGSTFVLSLPFAPGTTDPPS